MTLEEREQALRAFGYSPREARFVCCAALHSGYFLSRQFTQFIGTPRGKALADFTSRLAAFRHARRIPLRTGGLLYHLSAKPLYAALGEPDNRHRRTRTWIGIRSKVMVLDYVLSHLHQRYLATEEERIGYFVGTLGIDIRWLPQKRYESHRSGEKTTRYFVDKFPIALLARSETEAQVPAFVYVESTAPSLAGFHTYLGQYARLLDVLPDWRVIYAAESRDARTKARTVFERMQGSAGSESQVPTVEALLEYFRVRQPYERKQFTALSKAKLDALRTMQRRFDQPHIEALYEQWLVAGDGAIHIDEVARRNMPVQGHREFATYAFEHSYTGFDPIFQEHRGRRAATIRKRQVHDDVHRLVHARNDGTSNVAERLPTPGRTPDS